MKPARSSDMRFGVLLLLLVGCIDERETYVADPLIQIGSVQCHIAGAQIVIDGTFDVRLQAGQAFRVEYVSSVGGQKASYTTYGCNAWTKMQVGCARRDETQPENQPISLHATDNVSGMLPDTVHVELSGIVETDDLVVQEWRSVTCLR
jgi:hypothetical protein